MDMDELKEQLAHQQKLLKNYAKHMRIIEEQMSSHGIYPPSTLIVQLQEYQEKISSISEIKQKIETSLQSIVQETSQNKIESKTADVLIFAVQGILKEIGRTEDFLTDAMSRIINIITAMNDMLGDQRDFNHDFVAQFRLIQTSIELNASFMELNASFMLNTGLILNTHNDTIKLVATALSRDSKMLQTQIDELKQALNDKE